MSQPEVTILRNNKKKSLRVFFKMKMKSIINIVQRKGNAIVYSCWDVKDKKIIYYFLYIVK